MPNSYPKSVKSRQPITLDNRYLYQKIADEFVIDIQQGLYKPGQKIASVRKLSQQQQVSISTASQAYSLLEDRGYIQAKPQSGYFVRLDINHTHIIPPTSIGDSPAEVTKGKLIKQILESCQLPSHINFGAAILSMDALPQRAIQNHLQKAIRFQSHDVLNYQFSPGYEPLRIQIAQRMRNIGVRVHPDEIVITQGCTEALRLCLAANTEKGDTIAVESPCYYGFLQMAEVQGLKVIEIPTDPVTGISLEALQMALEQWSINLLMISSRYSNPTGCSLDSQKQQKLVNLINHYKIKALEDDVYGELTFGDPEQTVLKSFDTQGRILYCSSFSKTVAPGLRIGWCLPGKDLENIKNLQTFNTFSVTSITQCAMASYLQHGHYDKQLRILRRRSEDNMQKFYTCIREHFPPSTLLAPPLGGFVLWLCLPQNISAKQLMQRAQQQGMIIIPGDIFSNTEHFNHYIRINCAMKWNNEVENALVALAKLVITMHNENS